MTEHVEERPACLRQVRPASLYGLALRRLGAQWWVRSADGQRRLLDSARWLAPADATDCALLTRCAGPALDVGCGPGRLLVALRDAGLPALGLDVSPDAVRLARRAGGVLLLWSVFDRVPGEGLWSAALLGDGNIGIGGEPVALLRRVGALLAPGGRALVEVGAAGTPSGRARVRLEGGGVVSSWFPWSRVSVDSTAGPVRAAGLTGEEIWGVGDRWFAQLSPTGVQA